MTWHNRDDLLTRRMILGGAAGLAARAMLPGKSWGAGEAKPNSVFGGVRVGCITYSYRGGADTAEYTLDCLLKNGLSETELMDGPIRSFAGLPARAGKGKKGDKGNDSPQPIDADRPKVREGQLAKCEQLRKMFSDAGVNILIHKIPFGQTDDDIDFNF